MNSIGLCPYHMERLKALLEHGKWAYIFINSDNIATVMGPVICCQIIHKHKLKLVFKVKPNKRK